ncbi:MAG: hypothetical protein A2552_10790 [Sulfuricurvum sp. RIFOXYD2_FULL_44_160]|uniref:hypothetical protein n=1 Tax=unclassified Sulfuricurvum TaxID=2632390 RepID=UPI0008BC0B89|nr:MULTISPECIES: hypothetical protein [unclassified Sulfuricurvum]OHD92436.1 MAG: hypothetical protein A2517_08545 [Sulfuricurvum sp. RIFOXYD12_FULL_44_77]OHD97484.1 MAG: hypothetical protein A2552_10790 [Sulfuricurvum sp. RIFOXYD2_FULL_44_160]
MKLGKLSLVAVMALGTSAFAIDNVKVNGEAKVWYQTSEYSGAGAGATTSQDFFDNDTNSLAEVKLSVGATADLLQSLSAGVKVTALSTLGLENNMVGAVPAAKFDATGTSAGAAQLDDQSWTEELYLAYTMGKTTAKIGRQALSTPLAFTENWNVVDNTFEAAVLLNNDLPDTTLVAAYVGKHNGVGLLKTTTGRGSTVAYSGKFTNFGTEGAYAAGAINKSIPNTTVQGWYYNVSAIADAFWLQADAKVMDMVTIGVQYAGMDPKLSRATVIAAGYVAGNEDLAGVKKSSDVFAVKAAVDVAGVNLYAAYSEVSDGTLGFANTATGDKSSLYTSLGSIWLDGEIAAAPDTDTWKIGASTKLIPGVTLSTSYAESEVGANAGAIAAVAGAATASTDFTAWDVVAATKVGPVDLTAIYTQFDKDVKATDTTDKTTDTIRIIASLKF